MAPTEFHETLVQAEALRARTSNKDGIPGVQQDIASLQQRAANVALGGGGVAVGAGDTLSKARAFLPSETSKGMSRLAYSLELKSAFQPSAEPATTPSEPDVDLDTSLDSHYNMMIYKAIDEAAEAAEAQAHRAQLRWEAEDWETAKGDLRKNREPTPGMQMLELTLAQQERPELMDVVATMDLTPATALRLARGTSRLSDSQRRYAKAVGEATEKDKDDNGFCDRFLSVAKTISKSVTNPVDDHEEFRRTLELLRNMLEKEENERRVPIASPTTKKAQWSHLLQRSANKPQWSHILQRSAHASLEHDFYQHMERKVHRARMEGRVHMETQGPWGVIAAYVSLTGRGEEGGSEYDVLYYCLRAGKVDAAVRYALDHDVPQEVNAVLVALGRRPEEAQDAIKAVRGLYASREASTDVFERAVLNLLGYVNVGKMDKSIITRTTEDYLWWSLWFCSEANPANSSLAHGPSAAGRFSIEDLASKILRWGEAHFDRDGTKRFLYARVLFTVQLFREGVSHLAKTKHMEAVHIALVLDHYNLLTDLAKSTPLPPGTPPASVILETLVVGYIKDFKATDPTQAADYLMLLRPPERLERDLEGLLVETDDETARRDLAMHMKAKDYSFDYIVERRRGDGRTEPETKHYIWSEATARTILRRAGAQAESLDPVKAMSLHELGEDYVRALAVLNRQLCNMIVSSDAGREAWLNQIKRFEPLLDRVPETWEGQELKATFNRLRALKPFIDHIRFEPLLDRVPETWEGQELKATFNRLRALKTFFDHCDAGENDAAIRIVFQDLRLFPSRGVGLDRSMAKDTFEAATPEFKMVLAHVINRSMQALYNEYRARKRQEVDYRRWQVTGAEGGMMIGQGGTGARLEEVKEKGRALLEFAMSVSKDYLSNDTIAKLQRLESMMM